MNAKTLEVIAKRLSISRRTLSRALNSDKNVADDTRARILKHMEKEKYFPNINAANLASKKSNVIGLIFPKNTFTKADFFVIETMKGVAEAMEQANYQLMVFTQNEIGNTQCLKLYKSKMVFGLILVAISKENFAQVEELRKNNAPLSLLFAYYDRVNSFGCDNLKGGYLATKHLIDRGRKKIAFIHAASGWIDAEDRFEGYKKALSEAGMEFKKDYVENGFFDYEPGEAAMQKLLKANDPPDAVFAANDRMALGAVKAVKKSGRRIPEDIAIVGFDNMPLCELFEPSITTVEQPVKDIAYAGGKALIDAIRFNTQKKKPQTILFEPKLIIRESA